jgi:hypothetical protein
MELMRHSDSKLTTKTYTDAGLLPTAAAVRALPSLLRENGKWTSLGTLGIVPAGQSESPSVPCPARTDEPGTLMNTASGRDEALPVPLSPELPDGARCRVRTCQTPVEHQRLTEVGTPEGTLENGLRAGFEVCEVIRAWTKLPGVLRNAILSIVRSHVGDLSTNCGAKVAAARAPKGASSRAGAKPELPVCGQVGGRTSENSPPRKSARGKTKRSNKERKSGHAV